ncbi:MAG: hypothetical protein BWK78_07480, partial [Thiotrichaceae bacterium IS1]
MSNHHQTVRLDLNNPEFQAQWFALAKDQQERVLANLRKLSRMTWAQVYADRGLKWEVIHSRQGAKGTRLYSFRISQGFRALAYREEAWLRLLSLHPD